MKAFLAFFKSPQSYALVNYTTKLNELKFILLSYYPEPLPTS
jgi:hypothetical protein